MNKNGTKEIIEMLERAPISLSKVCENIGTSQCQRLIRKNIIETYRCDNLDYKSFDSYQRITKLYVRLGSVKYIPRARRARKSDIERSIKLLENNGYSVSIEKDNA